MRVRSYLHRSFHRQPIKAYSLLLSLILIIGLSRFQIIMAGVTPTPPVLSVCTTEDAAARRIVIQPAISEFVVDAVHPLILQLADAESNPVVEANVPVLVSVISQPEPPRLDVPLITLDPPGPLITDLNGQVAVTLNLGHTAGPFDLSIRVGPALETELLCQLTALPDRDTARLIQVSGNNQVAEPGEELANPLVVQLEEGALGGSYASDSRH